MRKHIVCFGDSNTHGYCADPMDTADGGGRFNEEERWPCLLQEKLGKEYLVLEEGLNGRTTVFEDPTCQGRKGLDSIYSCLVSHKPVDLLIIMLGTNDTKDRFSADDFTIEMGMERLITKAKQLPVWAGEKPNILLIAPPSIKPEIVNQRGAFSAKSVETSRKLASAYRSVAERLDCAFLNAEGIGIFNDIDCLHLTSRGHRNLAQKLAQLIPELI